MPPRRPPARPVWNEASGRYRSGTTGRFVSRQQVREYLDGAVENAGRRIQALGAQLQRREITVAEFQTGMRLALRDVHSYAAAVAQGGLAQMTPREWGHVGQTLRTEYRRLAELCEGVASQRIPLDGRFTARLRLAGLAGRATYEEAAQRDLRARGFDEERNVRRRGDSCRTAVREGCIDASALGWQKLGVIALPGTRTCLGNCRCFMRRRNSTTGAVAA